MNLSKIKLSQITFDNIKGFFQGHFNKKVRNGEYENYMYLTRLAYANVNCLKDGICPCGCEHPEKLYDPRPCDEGCYPQFISRAEYDIYRKSPMYDEKMEDLIEFIIEKLSTNEIHFKVEDVVLKGKKITKFTIYDSNDGGI